MILFSAIERDECLSAYYWHRGFAGANDALYPRQHDDFQSLVLEGSVWAAKHPGGDYLALAYASYDEESKVCEIGGLMVSTSARKMGLGSTLMRLALIHMLLEEHILSISGSRVVAHVLKSNNEPRNIIEHSLRFKHASSVRIPGSALPGLRTEPDGFVHGDEYEMTFPDTITTLAQWAQTWTGRLKDESVADIELRSGVDMKDWSNALYDLAETHQTRAS